MDNFEGFVPIVAIFYAVFHPTEGTKIVHQVPEGSIYSKTNDPIESDLGNDQGNESCDDSLFDFDTVKNCIIPKPQLCNKLVSFKIGKYKVIGYPVNLENPRYARNSFTFNFCFVFQYSMCDTTPYELPIKRIGRMFLALEEQSLTLSRLDKDNCFLRAEPLGADTASAPTLGSSINSLFGTQFLTREDPVPVQINAPEKQDKNAIQLLSIDSLINQIYQDLNNYSECYIPLDAANLVDIKLFPVLPPPVAVQPYNVPIATVKLDQLVDVSWDPTMIRIMPYIDGINSIKKISGMADADYLLTEQCIQHLMHYKCIIITDIFQFCNVYAPTNLIGDFLRTNGMAEECQAYVVAATTTAATTTTATPVDNDTPKTGLSKQSSFAFKRPPSLTSITSVRFEKRSNADLREGSVPPPTPGTLGSRHDSIRVQVPSKSALFHLYCSLNQGQSVKEWYEQHQAKLQNIDLRRFINFGVIRGLIYRVYTYPFLHSINLMYENGATLFSDVERHADKLIQHKRGREGERHFEKVGENEGHGDKKKMGHFSDRISVGSGKYYNTSQESLLQTKVNALTLRTGAGRRVSFSRDDKSSGHRKVLPRTFDEVMESSDEDYEDVQLGSSDAANRQGLQKGQQVLGGLRGHEDQEEGKGGDEEAELRQLLGALARYRPYDSICTLLNRSRAEIESRISQLGPNGAFSS